MPRLLVSKENKMDLDIRGRLVFSFRGKDEPWITKYLCFYHAIKRIVVSDAYNDIEVEIELYSPKEETDRSYYDEQRKKCVLCP